MQPIGFIGTGRIGNPMAQNVIKAGHPVHVHDIRRSACKNLVEMGAVFHETPASVADSAQYVVLSVIGVEDVRQVLFGEQGLCAAEITGKIIVDTSTGRPSASRIFAEKVKECGGAMLDAPVTGGENGARTGTLTFMVGGDEAVFQQSLDLLKVLGERIVHVGESGAGMVAKMANQMIMSGYFVVISEALAFIERMDVDVVRCLEALEHGGAQSKQLSGLGRRYREAAGAAPTAGDDHYTPLFKKDLSYALQEGLQHDCYMPVTAAAQEVLKQLLSAKLEGDFPLNILELWRYLNQ